MRLGHRLSRDLDWFTPRQFDANKLAAALRSLPEKPTRTTLQGPNTLRAYYGELETSFIRYAQVIAKPEILAMGALKIPVADVETLAVMKAAAVHDRGSKRDFVDIHALCRMPVLSLLVFDELQRPSEQLVRHDGALGDLGIVLAEPSQWQHLAAMPRLHGAISELDDGEARPGEDSIFLGVWEQEELTLVVEAQRMAELAAR